MRRSAVPASVLALLAALLGLVLLASAPAAAQQPDERPAIVPRATWDPTGACRPRTPPRYGRIDFAVVHHTESFGGYTRATAAANVLAICRFHRDGNGWLDIGYNLLIDRFGTIYEGRAGGVEQPVIGAQAGGWNGVSTGIAMIGSFTDRRPTPAAQEALERVLAWKLASAGVPPVGSVSEISPGGDENRWSAGTQVDFARVSGHRDADHSDCPGAALFAALPQLRARTAARWAIDSDRLTSSPIGGVLAQGGPAQLTGRLALAGGRRPVGARLSLQRREHAGAPWSELDTLRTRADGVWSAAVPVTVNGSFRVVSDARGIASPPVDAAVAAGVSAQIAPQLLRPGGTITVRGTTTPAKPLVTLLVERRPASGGGWRQVRRLDVATSDGAYEVPLRLPRAGLHRILLTTPADALNAAGIAPLRTAQVRAPRARGRRGRG